MMIVSFAWTTPALLADRKTVTRRDWRRVYAERFRKDQHIAAYDRSPRIGGRQVATVRLTQAPYLENIADAPEADYEAEGLAYMAEQGKRVQGVPPLQFWREWRSTGQLLYVVRFELIEVLQLEEVAS